MYKVSTFCLTALCWGMSQQTFFHSGNGTSDLFPKLAAGTPGATAGAAGGAAAGVAGGAAAGGTNASLGSASASGSVAGSLFGGGSLNATAGDGGSTKKTADPLCKCEAPATPKTDSPPPVSSGSESSTKTPAPPSGEVTTVEPPADDKEDKKDDKKEPETPPANGAVATKANQRSLGVALLVGCSVLAL